MLKGELMPPSKNMYPLGDKKPSVTSGNHIAHSYQSMVSQRRSEDLDAYHIK